MDVRRAGLLALCLIVMLSSPALSQDEAQMPPMGRPAELDQLAFMLGEWDVAMQMRMAPDAPWTETTGKAKSETILDGCVHRMEFSADVMGMPMNGVDHTTFNRETGQFESVWVDNMSANFSMMHGGLEGDTFVMTGTMKRMGMDVMAKSIATKESDDVVHWTMEESIDGGKTWVTSMKMTYTRVK